MMGGKDRRQNRDQARRLRHLVACRDVDDAGADHRTHIIAVTSGKGGVGKTLVAANLSIALAARGHRVVLFDMDMGLANADIVLGVEAACTWRDVLAGRRTIDDVIVEAPGGVSLVPGVSGVSRMANLSEFERHQLMAAMRQVAGRYDVMILDCGAGISRNVVQIAASAHTTLVLTTPEPTALTDAYAMIKAFAQDETFSDANPPPSIGVVINQVDNRREGSETFERLAGVAARFLHLPLTDFGYILRDERVAAAVRQRYPVVLGYPRCAASTCLLATASRLSREMGQPETSQSLFYRVMNMFM